MGAPRLARAGRSAASLLAALFELARDRRLERVEVGLPRERFAGLAATEAFYLRNGFTPLGPRMRRSLAVSELLMVEQRRGRRDAAPWVLAGGRRLPGRDHNRRLAALRRGLLRHRGGALRSAPTLAASRSSWR